METDHGAGFLSSNRCLGSTLSIQTHFNANSMKGYIPEIQVRKRLKEKAIRFEEFIESNPQKVRNKGGCILYSLPHLDNYIANTLAVRNQIEPIWVLAIAVAPNGTITNYVLRSNNRHHAQDRLNALTDNAAKILNYIQLEHPSEPVMIPLPCTILEENISIETANKHYIWLK